MCGEFGSLFQFLPFLYKCILVASIPRDQLRVVFDISISQSCASQNSQKTVELSNALATANDLHLHAQNRDPYSCIGIYVNGHRLWNACVQQQTIFSVLRVETI